MTITYVNSAKDVAQLIVSAIAIIGALATVFKLISKGQKKQQEQSELIKNANLALLHDRLYQNCNFYISRKWITSNDLRNLDYMYKPYHALGGNDICTVLVDRCKSLEIRQGE